MRFFSPLRLVFLVVGAFAFVCFFSPLTQAGSNDRRLDKVEGDVDTLYRAVFSRPPPAQGEGPMPIGTAAAASSTALTQMGDRIQSLEDQNRTLIGQVEEQGYALETLRSEIEALKTQNNSEAPPQTTSENDPSLGGTLTGGQPTQVYGTAYSLFQEGRYLEAKVGFEDFLERWPQHELSANAQYWVGESLMQSGDFEAAARAFALAYQTFPKATKSPDMLLGLAMALESLSKTPEACTTLTKLQTDFPAGTSPALAQGKKEFARLSCL